MKGIIQEVIEPKIKGLLEMAKKYPEDADAYKYAISYLQWVQETLIEDVKNEVKGSHYILVQRLIGDKDL